MRVIICGAGQVGYHIAAYLAREDNDVTVIDVRQDLIDQINGSLDVNGIVGHASNPEVLSAAGASDADMIVAVTHSDEVNMVACQVAHSLFGVPKKIARIREQAYLDPAWSNLFSRAHMPIDIIISPEVLIAEDIYQRLSVPGTTYVIPMAEGKVHLIGVICRSDCPIINTPIGQFGSLFPGLSFEVVTIIRNNKPIYPDKGEQLQVGDEVYFVVDSRHLQRVMTAFGHREKEARMVVIVGGGQIGLGLVRLLDEKARGIGIKIIERSDVRARTLSEQLSGTLVIQGDGLDKDILSEASVEYSETLVAVTDNDESNILCSLLAKQYGCDRVITLVNNNAYTPLIGPLGVDSMVSPRAIIVSAIMRHVRRGRIRALYNLRDGFAEIIEAEVSETSGIANAMIGDLRLPAEVKIAALVRGTEILIPDSELTIRPGDVAIVFAAREHVLTVERMFSVQVDLF